MTTGKGMRCYTVQQLHVDNQRSVFEIHRFLHFVDNSFLALPGTLGYDKLGKIQLILTVPLERFSSIYTPGCDISIDKGVIPFKGRSSLKQYMPKKSV